MKKILALFTAMAFALTLGTAFAQENAATAAGEAPAKTEKAPAKTRKHIKTRKHVKKHAKKHQKATAPAEAPAAK